jgi:hypothetical protein
MHNLLQGTETILETVVCTAGRVAGADPTIPEPKTSRLAQVDGTVHEPGLMPQAVFKCGRTWRYIVAVTVRSRQSPTGGEHHAFSKLKIHGRSEHRLLPGSAAVRAAEMKFQMCAPLRIGDRVVPVIGEPEVRAVVDHAVSRKGGVGPDERRSTFIGFMRGAMKVSIAFQW